jgi:hypothetical protein
MTHQEHLLGFSFGRNRAIEHKLTAFVVLHSLRTLSDGP